MASTPSRKVSKENAAVSATRNRRPACALSGRKNRSLWLTNRLASPRWVSTTPLGRPVDPDV